MSSLVIRPEEGTVYGSSGNDFFRLDLASGTITDLGLTLKDSHEVTEIDGTLWIANTGRDEAVAFDLTTQTVTRRLPVRSNRGADPAPAPAPSTAASDDGGETVDKFHANQIVRALDGRLYVLVHHVDGKQIVKYVAQRLVKMQGNGGVIELDTGRPVPLSLSGPHSIAAVGAGEQWICDSRAGVAARVRPRLARAGADSVCRLGPRRLGLGANGLRVRRDLLDPEALPPGHSVVTALAEHDSGLRHRRPRAGRRGRRAEPRDDQQRLRHQPRDRGAAHIMPIIGRNRLTPVMSATGAAFGALGPNAETTPAESSNQ